MLGIWNVDNFCGGADGVEDGVYGAVPMTKWLKWRDGGIECIIGFCIAYVELETSRRETRRKRFFMPLVPEFSLESKPGPDFNIEVRCHRIDFLNITCECEI